jgi:superfamily II DNA or RNA helicase
MQLGPVRFTVDSRSKGSALPFRRIVTLRKTGFDLATPADQSGIQVLYAQLAADKERNDLICADVIRALGEGRSPIILTERRDHLEYFTERLSGYARHLFALHGSMKTRQRRETLASLAAVPADETRVLLATGRYIGEGFDDARLDTLFLALPISWKGTLIQYAGRLHRVHAGKTEVRVYDYVDQKVPMLARMSERRLRGYHAMGYVREDENEGKEQARKSWVPLTGSRR